MWIFAPGYQNFVGFETGANGRRIPVFSYYNVNKARIQGVETELKIPFNDEWKLSINYTYNDGRDVSNGENKPLSDLPFHISTMVSSRASVSLIQTIGPPRESVSISRFSL